LPPPIPEHPPGPRGPGRPGPLCALRRRRGRTRLLESGGCQGRRRAAGAAAGLADARPAWSSKGGTRTDSDVDDSGAISGYRLANHEMI
jgi:hypothetical protein